MVEEPIEDRRGGRDVAVTMHAVDWAIVAKEFVAGRIAFVAMIRRGAFTEIA